MTANYRRVDVGIVQRGKSYRFTVCQGYDKAGKQLRRTMTYRIPDNVCRRSADRMAREAYLRFSLQCREYGADHVVLVSIHINAAGCGQWMQARGWSAYTSRGQTRADNLAESLYHAAQQHLKGHKIRTDHTDGDMDCEAGFYILRHTLCPAVLTENLFMDNHKDLDFLLSPDGRESLILTHVDGISEWVDKLIEVS